MNRNKDIVVQAAKEMLVDVDLSAADRWAAPDYRENSAQSPSGANGLRHFVLSQQPHIFDYRLERVIGDQDMVALHGVYEYIDTVGPMVVAFDVFRVEAGKLAEHWAVRQPVVTITTSGRTQVDGPTQATAPELTEASRKVAVGFVQTVLFDRQLDRIGEFVATEHFAQHNPTIADGVDALRASLELDAAYGMPIHDPVLHYALADGEFVLTMSEAMRDDISIVFYDLFRVTDDKIVEHWDVIRRTPATLAHRNPLF
ncbi:nuclear transport factor 2 family protein [Nocardia sp. CA-128927]|uniref:nuclear transport factor 2 family protein n=1 Tax=Nocardia sp. CA-128927 TaxID=3239975 RepID=UPI003D98DA18